MGITEATTTGGGGTPGHADAPLAAAKTGPQHGLLGGRRCLTVGRARLSHARFVALRRTRPLSHAVSRCTAWSRGGVCSLRAVAYTFAAATYYYVWCQGVVSSHVRELTVELWSIGGAASIQWISRARWCVFCRCTGDIMSTSLYYCPLQDGKLLYLHCVVQHVAQSRPLSSPNRKAVVLASLCVRIFAPAGARPHAQATI